MNLDKYKDKKILILGLGREGKESLQFFLDNCPESEIGAADRISFDKLDAAVAQILKENPQIKFFLGENYLNGVDDYDIIVKSPGIPIHILEVERLFLKNKITSQTEIFFEQCPGIIIGVTGTKGKSTTSSIIYEILKKGGKNVFLIGNIGTPMIPFLKTAKKDDIFVCELSAHQLYGLRKSPHIGVLLNIYPEHLDYYKDFSEYIRAKTNIALNQRSGDYFIYNSASPEVEGIASKCVAHKIPFNEYKWEYCGETKLIGKFNLENAKIGAMVGRILGISDEIINRSIKEFKPLRHRLELVGNFGGIDCYNDSLSTIQESAVAAIEGLGQRVWTLIAGGFDRGQPFDKLAAAVLDSNIKTLILFPTTGERIWNEIVKRAQNSSADKRFKKLKVYFVDSMDKAAERALSDTDKGKICLLSAASASFNNFRDYADRGESFKKSLINQANKNNG